MRLLVRYWKKDRRVHSRPRAARQCPGPTEEGADMVRRRTRETNFRRGKHTFPSTSPKSQTAPDAASRQPKPLPAQKLTSPDRLPQGRPPSPGGNSWWVSGSGPAPPGLAARAGPAGRSAWLRRKRPTRRVPVFRAAVAACPPARAPAQMKRPRCVPRVAGRLACNTRRKRAVLSAPAGRCAPRTRGRGRAAPSRNAASSAAASRRMAAWPS